MVNWPSASIAESVTLGETALFKSVPPFHNVGNFSVYCKTPQTAVFLQQTVIFNTVQVT